MKIDRMSLEHESDSKLSNEHLCQENDMPDQLRIFQVDEYAGKPQEHFELFTVWVSTIEDVQAGEAQEIGEVLNLSSIKVYYCPFCGVKLQQ